MKYSPCGMGVDLIKYPYEAPCRFIDDPAAPTSTVRWTVAQPDADVLPFPSAIYNVVMEPEPQRWDLDVGEQWDGFGRVAKWNKTPVPITGKKFCGVPSDFFDGGVYDPSAPPAVYGANGWLVCCAQAPVFFGGAGAGGNCHPVAQRAIKQYGYAGGSGKVTIHQTGGPTPSGGGKAGGFLQFQLSAPPAPAGGGKGGGLVQFQLSAPPAPSGGGKAGGLLLFQLSTPGGLSGGGKGGGALAYPLSPATPLSGGGKGGGALKFALSPTGGLSGGGKGGGALANTVSVPGVRASNKQTNFIPTSGYTTPAAAVAGDLLVFTLVIGDLVAVNLTTAGWTEFEAWGTSTNFGQVQCLSYKKTAAGGAETISFSAPSTHNASAICVVVEKTAVDTFNNGGSQGATSSATITAGPITPTGSSDVGLGWYQIMGLRTITLPGVLTSLQSVQVSGGFESATLAVGWEQLSGTGAWNPGSATASAADFNDSLTMGCK